MRPAQASRQVGDSNATLPVPAERPEHRHLQEMGVRMVRDMSDNMRLGRAERCRPNSSP